jgi:hypothetical protein
MSFKAPMNTNGRIGQTVVCRGGMVCIGGGTVGVMRWISCSGDYWSWGRSLPPSLSIVPQRRSWRRGRNTLRLSLFSLLFPFVFSYSLSLSLSISLSCSVLVRFPIDGTHYTSSLLPQLYRKCIHDSQNSFSFFYSNTSLSLSGHFFDILCLFLPHARENVTSRSFAAIL